MKWILVFILVLSSTAFADSIDITPEYIEQMAFKISQPMPCNWDPSRTTIFGYYGQPETARTPQPPVLSRSTQDGDLKSRLFQKDLELPTQVAFGLYLNLEFTREMMAHDDMPLQLVEIDYKPLNKRCESGFGPGLLTR